MTAMDRQCVRQTKLGRRCLGIRPQSGEDTAPACTPHMTATEVSTWRELLEVKRARDEAAYARLMDFDPACWSWPVPALAPDEVADEEDALSHLIRWHKDRCAICGARGHLLLDHDHATGLVRGNLCRSCNTREAFQSHDPSNGFERYRQRPPAAILNMRCRYWDPFNGYAEPPAEPLPIGDPRQPSMILGEHLAALIARSATQEPTP